MAEKHSRSEGKISKTERRCIVGYRPKGGDRSTPKVSLSGKWLKESDFEVGTGVSLKVIEGCLVLIPDGPEEIRLRERERLLKVQPNELEQALHQVKTTLV